MTGKELEQPDKAGGLGRLRAFVICHFIRQKSNIDNCTAWHTFVGHRLRSFTVLERVWHLSSHIVTYIYEPWDGWPRVNPFPHLPKEGDHAPSLIRLSWASNTQRSPWSFHSDLNYYTGTGSSFQSWNLKMPQAPQFKCFLGFFFCLFFQVKGKQNLPLQNNPLWCKDYFWLAIFKKQQTRKKLRTLSYPFVREMSIYKGSLHLERCLLFCTRMIRMTKSLETLYQWGRWSLKSAQQPYPFNILVTSPHCLPLPPSPTPAIVFCL